MPADPDIRFSLIIPAWNEAALLPRLLDTVDVARARYRHGAEAVEVIVADNMSTDETARIAASRGAHVVRVEKRAIAAARNGGAARARGAILAFVDSDTRIHPDTFNAIDESLATGKVVGGATGVRLERWSFGLAATWMVMIPMVVVMRMDTGVVFCRREDFIDAGGYNEQRLFAEDVEFLFALRRLGKTRGQRLARVTTAKAIASTRKFDRWGDWHYFTQVFRLAGMMIRSPSKINDFARRYWYEGR